MIDGVGTMQLALIGAMAWTAVAILKHLRVKQYNDALTIVVIVGIAFVATVILGASHFAGVIAHTNVADKFLIAYGATSVLRVGYEFKKALDGTDSAKEAKLIPDKGAPPAA